MVSKYSLPAATRLRIPRVDLEQLQKECRLLQGLLKPSQILNKNFGLDRLNPEPKVHSFIEEVPLTIPKDTISQQAINQHLGHKISNAKSRYSSQGEDSYGEKSFVHKQEFYKGTYLESVVESVSKKNFRVRFVRLKAQGTVPRHVDYTLRYGMRFIIPIETNDQVHHHFWYRNQRQTFNLIADGSIYFLNVGHYHSVENNSNMDRDCLLFSSEYLPLQHEGITCLK